MKPNYETEWNLGCFIYTRNPAAAFFYESSYDTNNNSKSIWQIPSEVSSLMWVRVLFEEEYSLSPSSPYAMFFLLCDQNGVAGLRFKAFTLNGLFLLCEWHIPKD